MKQNRFVQALLSLFLTFIGLSLPSTWAQEEIVEAKSDAQSLLAAGPLVGFGGIQEVTLWVQTKRPARVSFRYWPRGHSDQAITSREIMTSFEGDLIGQLTLSGLPEGTRFTYALLINGAEVFRPYPLHFQTQARWQRRTPPPDFAMAIGSCAYFNLDESDRYGGGEEIYEQIRAQNPDLMLWLGDNVYLGPEDWSSPEGIARRYAVQRSQPSLQALFGSVHQYAIWDDHDFGPNDGNRSFPLKGASLSTFKRYWPNPNYGVPELAGAFGTFSWSDVDFFLLDDRTFRAPPIEGRADRPMLGDEQLNWVLDALSGSRAPFKIVAVGSQVLNPYSRFEGYAQHAQERDALIAGIKERKIEGVVFLSGDRHFAELNRVANDPEFYPLYDFTSSPLTSGLASSVEDERANPRRVEGTLVSDRKNFGILRFSGSQNARMLTLEARDAQGALLWQRTIHASELTFSH